jgi:hypothetical protein
MALSTNTPVGSPSGPRRISPPAGSTVAAPMPASDIARAFTQTA